MIYSKLLRSEFVRNVWPRQLQRLTEPWAIKTIPRERFLNNICRSIDLASELINRFDDITLPIDDIERFLLNPRIVAMLPPATLPTFADLRQRYIETQRRMEERYAPESESDDDSDVDYASFREVSVFPSTDEIVAPEYHMSPINIIKGTYDSVDQYLHTHFHLLRDDCLIPLRDGILQHLSGKPSLN